MAEPRIRSYQQILGDKIDAFIARSGVNDLRVGSAVLSILEASAQSDFRSSQDIFAVLTSMSLDRAEGSDLDALANDQDVERFTSLPATGKVTIVDGSFDKVATKIYPGVTAPNIGSMEIFVVDASDFPDSGDIYLGRNTQNVEGPLSYSSKTQVGSFWKLTLPVGTSKFHNLSETVVLANGGNRIIPSGTSVRTPQSDAASAVEFITTATVTIPDGENEFENIPVVSTKSGVIGNVPRNAIFEVPNSIFPNISAANPLPFVTGRDEEVDAELRERVKIAIQSRGKGTKLAIENAVIGLRAVDEPKSIISATVVEQTGLPTTLVIDDGTGYEELFTGIGQVNIVDRALGGEQFLQLPHRAITKAQLLSAVEGPFGVFGAEILALEVGGVGSEHTFLAADFKSPGAATAFEVTSSINGNSNLLFSASTVDGAKGIRIFAKLDSTEDMLVLSPVSGTDANTILQLNENTTYTLNLYKNDLLLFKDGIIPVVTSANQADWSSMADPETLIIDVDGTGNLDTAKVTYTFEDIDFVSANTGYSTLSNDNSLEAWVAVFNNRIAGVTAKISGAQITLESNRGADNDASIAISASSTLVTAGMFTVALGLSDTGQSSDYDFNRNTGQISLVTALVEDDTITAGSNFTRGYVQTSEIVSGFINLTSDANLWFIVDGAASAVSIEALGGSTLIVTNEGDNIWRYKISTIATAFTNVQAGDWFVVWDSGIGDPTNLGFWRVAAVGVDAGSAYIEVEKSLGVATSYTLSSIGGEVGLAVARSSEPMQQVTIVSGVSKSLATIVGEINAQIIGANASVVGGDIIRVTPLTFDSDGGNMIVTVDISGKALLFTEGDVAVNRISHTAFSESQNSEVGTPLFIHDEVATGDSSEPPVNIVGSFNFEPYGGTPTTILGFLKPLTSDRYSSNENNHTQLSNITNTALTLASKETIHEVISGTAKDRIFPAMSYDLDSEDIVVAVIDQDAVNKTFSIPLARNITITNFPSPPTATKLNVYDTDRGATETLDTTFGTFDFSRFKVWSRARTVLDPTNNLNALIYRYADYGPDGNNCRLGYFYPSQPSLAINSISTTGKFTSINIILPSDPEVSLGHSATTEYDVTSVLSSGAYNVTFTWNSVGPTPDFVSNGVVVGNIVNIKNVFNSNNQGTYRVTAVIAGAITVRRPTAGTAELAIALATISNIQIYPLAGTSTGQDIKDYVDANLTDYLTATATDEDPSGTPNDLTGDITLSTLDENGYRNAIPDAATGATRASNIVTIDTTIAGAHGFNVGDSIVLSGGTLGASTLSFEGTFAIETIPSINTFTFTQIGPDEDEGGGTVVDAGYQMLLDGENSIASSNLTADPQLTLRKSLQFSHALYNLLGETFRLVPTTADQVSRYVNVLGVSGITSVAGVTTSEHSERLQIYSNILGSEGSVQVTGGTGNSTAGSVLGSASVVDTYFTRARVGASQKQGFHAGQFIKITSSSVQPKILGTNDTTTIEIIAGSPNTIDLAGAGSFSVPKVDSGGATTTYQVEKQGDFLCIVHMAGTAPDFAAASIEEGDWIVIDSSSGFTQVNLGTFRVIRIFGDSIYIENSTGVEEITTATGGATPLKFFTYDSVRPGDTFKISGDVLDVGTDSNEGEFTVSAVNSSSQIEVDGIMFSTGSPVALGDNFDQVQILEAEAFEAIKRVHSVVLNPSDLGQLDIILKGTIQSAKINSASGSAILALNKFNFKTSTQLGIDGYKRHLGLIWDANRTVYSDPANPSSFPGVKAAGAQLNIQGPIIKRIEVSMAIRVRTGVPFNEVEEEAKNGISAVIASVAVGDPVVISDLVTAVGAVDGVLAVSVVSPTYDSQNDLIAVQAFEKPLIIDPDTDITIAQIGE